MASQKKSRTKSVQPKAVKAQVPPVKQLKCGMALFGTAAVMASSVGLAGLSAAPAFAAPSASIAAETATNAGANQIINVDAIASDQITNGDQLALAQTTAKDVVSDRASIVTPIGGGQLTATYTGYEAFPADIPVYMQWIDEDGTVSPIYSATTHEIPGSAGSGGKGMYAFAVPTFTDANGQEHRFVTGTNQKYRVWAEPFTNPATGNLLRPLRNAPGYTPYSFGAGTGDGLGEFSGAELTNGNMTRTGVWMYEVPSATTKADSIYKSSAPVYDSLGALDNPTSHYDGTAPNTLSGNVWLETGNERQLFKSASQSGYPAASGYTVWATTLTGEGKQYVETNINTQPEANRAALTKQMLEQHSEYIATTVYGDVREDGRYTLRFPTETYDQDLMYMWVENPAGEVQTAYSTFTQPVFQNPRNNLALAPTADPAVNNAAGLADGTGGVTGWVNF